MRIRRLLLRSFGCLQGEFHFSADRANLILEPNERGKSTLSAAILAGLYGFPPGQRRSESRPIVDAEVYRPWEGAEYLVEMDVEAGGEAFTIRRDFDARKEQVFELRSGKEVTSRFQKGKDHLDFAGTLTGLDRDDFARTAYLRQTEMQLIRDSGGITAALQRMATSQQGDVAAAEATGILTDALRQYRGRKIRRGKIESELAGIDEEIQSLSAKLEEMEARRSGVEEELRELERTAREADGLKAELTRLEYLIIAAGRAEDQGRLEEENTDKRELAAREKEFQELASYEEFPSALRGRLGEIKVRLEALAGEERRLRERQEEEVETPLREWRELARESEGLRPLEEEEMARLGSLQTDLAASWRGSRDARRSLRALERRMRESGTDPERVRELSARFSSLTPEERRFLMDYRASEAEARRAVEDSLREAGEAELELEAEGRSSALRLWLAVAGGAALAASAALALLVSTAWALGAAALGAALLAVRFTLLGRGRASESEEALLERHRRARSESAGALRELEAGLERIAASVGMDDPGELLESYREAESMAGESGAVASLQRSLQKSRQGRDEACREIGSLMERAGHRPRFGAVTPATVRAFVEALAERAGVHREVEALQKRGRGLDEDLQELETERRALHAEAASILQQAGMDPGLDPAEALPLFEEACGRKERYQVLKKEIIPGLVRRAMGRQDENLARRIEATGVILRRREEEQPDLKDLVPEKSHKEYIEERDRLKKESSELEKKHLRLTLELSEVLREYRRDYPDTQRWLREWEAQRERALAFKSSVELARDVLEELSREAYAEWADVLNEKASEMLAFLVPGYEDLRFDENLTLSLREARSRERRSQPDIDLRFSAGTRDQIYLAARVAMAGYLSTGTVKLPLILDDPFTSFDDERFARAMRMLLDKLARRHQLIILSCHEARHRAWQDRHPELFADRVRIMTLQAVAS